MQAPVEHRGHRGRNPLQTDDRPEPEARQRRQLEAARHPGQVAQRVSAGVAVGTRVGECSDTARVEDDYERAPQACSPVTASRITPAG